MSFLENFLNSPLWLQAFFFFLQGSIFGSFANVLIYRLPREEKISLLKKSFCPSCKTPIPFYLNIPILSFFFLLGKCLNCKKKISIQYPLVELLMALIFLFLFLHIGWKWWLLESLIFGFMLLVASFIDLEKMIIPDSLTLGGIGLGLVAAFLNPEREFLPALYGVLLGGGFLLFVAWAYFAFRKQEGMGGGDIKMMGWIGAVLGFKSCFSVLLLSSILGSVIGASILLLQRNKSLKTHIPFGPYLALGALAYVFFGESLSLNFFFP